MKEERKRCSSTLKEDEGGRKEGRKEGRKMKEGR
jgi:hypothetical protein